MEQNMHLCGKTSCMQLLQSTVSRLGWQAGVVLALMLIAAPNLVLVMAKCMIFAPRQDMQQEYGQLAVYNSNPRGAWCSSFGGGPYGEDATMATGSDEETRLLSASCSSYAAVPERYSAAMRIRKSTFFKQPIDMGGSHVKLL